MIALVLVAVCDVQAQPTSVDRPPPDRGGPRTDRDDDAPPPRDDDGPPDLHRPPRPGPPFGKPRLWTDLPEEERRHVEKFIEDHFPRMFLELRRLEEESPRRYIFRMSRMAPQMRRIMDTIKVDPQRGALMVRERQIEMEIVQSAMLFRQSTDERTKSRLRARIEELAAQIFDIRHERRADEVRELETRLDLLRNRLTESQSMRTELIQRQVQQILTRPPPPFAAEEESDPPPPPPGESP